MIIEPYPYLCEISIYREMLRQQNRKQTRAIRLFDGISLKLNEKMVILH